MRIFGVMAKKEQDQSLDGNNHEQLAALEESWAAHGKDGFDTGSGVVLKDWSAQDFANIYVRFRPHLISHARKFLREHAQAEEIVQDAFLYLMTALPELDSELGVLRFLKWKTKMLCFDYIRAESKRREEGLSLDALDLASPLETSSDLERADDSALVIAALSRLSVRQKEALISSVYLELPHELAAERMGMSQNSFRQLLFRARRAFRFALIGEADVAGKSVAEILSLAAKKASLSSVPKSALSTAILGVLLVGTLWTQQTSEIPTSPLAASYIAEQEGIAIPNTPSQEVKVKPDESVEFDLSAITAQVTSSQAPGGALRDEPRESQVVPAPKSEPEIRMDEPQSAETTDEVRTGSRRWASIVLTDLTSKREPQYLFMTEGQVKIDVGESASLYLVFDPENDFRLSHSVLRGRSEMEQFIAIPTATSEVRAAAARTTQIVLTGFVVSRLDPSITTPVVADSHFYELAVEIKLDMSSFDENQSLIATAEFLPRS